LIILQRQTKRPVLTQADRGLMVLLARWVRHWRVALMIVKPETLLSWHRQGFRLYWRRKSQTTTLQQRIPQTTIDLIQQMAVGKPTLGSQTHSRRAAEGGATCQQTDRSALHAPGAP
jgi:hypothetical protein